MRTEINDLTIHLENEREIETFWNIIAFALDLQAERNKKGEVCMTEEEIKMAHRLYDITRYR